MAVDFRVVATNTAPSYTITCKRNGTAISLADASTVTMIIKNKTTGSITQSGKNCAITTPASGIITYTSDVTDFPSKGKYVGDVKITYSGGGVERLYKQVTWLVRDPIE